METTPRSPIFPDTNKKTISFQECFHEIFPAKSKLTLQKSLISEKTPKRKYSNDESSDEDGKTPPIVNPLSFRKTTSSLIFVGKLLRRLPTYKPNISTFDQNLNLNDPSDLEKAKQMLKKRREARNMNEINVLARSFESIELFQEIKNGLEPVLYLRLFKELIYEEFQANQFIFRVNDPPDKLYILLSGEVCILAPKEAPPNNSFEKFGKKQESKTDVQFSGYTVMNLIHKFQSFGEIALRNNTPRTATAACKTNVEVVSLDKKTFRSVLKVFFENQAAEKFEYLCKIPLFKGIANHYLQGLLLHLKEKIYKKGDVIFSEGSKVETLYIIKEGEVQARKTIDLKDMRDQMISDKCDSKEKIYEVMTLKDMEKFKELNSSWARKFTLLNKKSQILFCLGKGECFGEKGLLAQKNEADFTMICNSLTVILFTISYQKISENLRMIDHLGQREIKATIAKIKEQRSIFSKAVMTEGAIMKSLSRKKTEEKFYEIPKDEVKRMQTTSSFRNVRPEKQI